MKVAIGVVVGLLIGSTTAMGSGRWRTVNDFFDLPRDYQHGYVQGMSDALSVVTDLNKDGKDNAGIFSHIDACLDRHQEAGAGASAGTYLEWAVKALRRSKDKGYGNDSVASAIMAESCF